MKFSGIILAQDTHRLGISTNAAYFLIFFFFAFSVCFGVREGLRHLRLASNSLSRQYYP